MNIIKNALKSYKDINEYNNKKVNNCPIVHAIEDSDDVFFCKQESVLIIKTFDTLGSPIIGNEDILKQPCKMYIDGVECEVTSTPQIELVELENGEYKEYEIKYVFHTPTLTNCNRLINVSYDLGSDFIIQLCHTVDLTDFDTSNVTDMSYMFNGSFLYEETLNVIGLSNLNTSNVTNMEGMFYGANINCNGDDFKNWDTSKVTNMSNMFNGSYKLTSLDLSSFNTSKVTRMDYMFRYCYNLTSLDLSSFDTSKVTNMNYMFYACQGLTSLDLSNFNTSKVTDMSHMFEICRNLTSLKVDSFNASKVIDMSYMFNGCKKLKSLDLSNFNTLAVTNMSYMFNYCSALTSIKGLNSFNTPNLTDMSYIFCWCDYLTLLDLSSFNTSNVTNMKAAFRGGITNGSHKSFKFGKNAYVNNVSSYDVMFTSSDDEIILCNNTKESWEILINNIGNLGGTSNPIPQIEYYDCE